METHNLDMRVTKRNGELQDIAFDKILNRIKILGQEANIQINYASLAMKVIDQLYDKIPTSKIDELAAEQCASMSTIHTDYATLASRIVVSNHHKNTDSSFYNVMKQLYEFIDIHGNNYPLVSEELWNVVSSNRQFIDSIIDYNRDYLIEYFGFKTLERSYLFKIGNKIIERPQHMWLRVAIGIHGTNLDAVKETYDLMSQKYFTHATPTLFNAGTPRPQLSSCYLIAMDDDSIEGIYNTLKDCALISKYSGGIGLHIHNIRAKGSHIKGTNGKTDGLVPMLRVFNNTARYVNQSGRRNGSFAIYLEPWHADIFDFLELRKNHGDEELKARDLFYALWIPDLFMERVKMTNGKWSLFCPHECPGLQDVYGDKFKTLYESYESQGLARKTINARELWFAILDAQMETGTPYILYKDSANKKSNQQNLGTIKSSNLCVAPETLVLTDKGHIEIKSLEGQKINVWNGEEFSETTIVKTGEKQQLIRVYLSDSNHLDCTPYHKFYIIENDKIIMKEARELVAKDILLECEFPNIELRNKNYIFKSLNKWIKHALVLNNNLIMECLVPTQYIYLKRLLQTIGITIKYFKSSYIILDFINAVKLTKLGYNNIVIQDFINANNDNIAYNENNLYVDKIVDKGRIDDTYCFTEPKRHMGIFNGILTGQCSEIIEYSDDKETAVCNLASIALPSFVNQDTKQFDYDNLHKVTKVITNNLNKVIDINFYPTEKTKRSNMLHRPIGVGVQGLADTFILMDIPFHSEQAKQINKMIFETIYHAGLERSNEIAIERKEILLNSYYRYGKTDNSIVFTNDEYKNLNEELCGAYSSFIGSPASQGILQFDMWNVKPTNRYDWNKLKKSIVEHGLRNSLLCAPMPTASTSQILGFNECFEPFTSNIYTRQTLAGEFIIVNKYLMKELIELGLWNEEIKNNIIANKGSIQQLTILSEHMRNKYKIVWEIPMRHLIDMAADRGAFICQSQSLNLWMEDPVYNKLTSMHFYSWEKGLKTGIYYLRRKAKHQAQQFTIEPELKQKVEDDKEGICEMCSA
jgi:ribonucleotide reductase alpha subunit